MSDTYVQLPSDGAGKKTRTLTATVSGHEVHQSVVIPAGKHGYTADDLTVRTADSGQNTYVGKAPIGTTTSASGWQIQRIQDTGTTLTILWADGNNEFDNVWDNRASLSYS